MTANQIRNQFFFFHFFAFGHSRAFSSSRPTKARAFRHPWSSERCTWVASWRLGPAARR